MSVKFVFDEYGLSNQDDFDIVITPNLSSIAAARSKVVSFLSDNQKTELKILLKSRAVYRRMRDLLDLNHVEPLYTVHPNELLSKKLGFRPPIWLTNKLISQLQLLKHETLQISQEFFLRDLLLVVEFEVFRVSSFKEFVLLICKETTLFKLFLQISAFTDELVNFFRYELNVEEKASNDFVNILKESSNIHGDLQHISYHQALLVLKNYASKYELSFSFPALEIHDSLVHLPLIHFYSDDSDLGTKYANILELLVTNFYKEGVAKALVELVIFPWPQLLICLENKIKANPSLISPELVTQLKKLNSPLSKKLADNLEAKSKLNSLSPISKDAETKSVIDWSYKYFELIKQDFESEGFEYDSILANSFSDWLISQKARIEKSTFDWRQVSESINESLIEGNITVVFMIDALSQIHYESLNQILGSIDNLSYQQSLVFAPLPTITKIGKKSVLTGLLPNKTSNNDLDLLLSRYGSAGLNSENILILQDWKRTKANQLTDNTKLAVVYINELDDRLHKTPTFNKHANDALSIVKTVRKTIEKWVQTSYTLNKNISFYITADHGVTSLNSVIKNSFGGKSGERVVELTQKPDQIPEDFYFLPSYTDAPGYIVPKNRASFDKPCALSHGGITPEEVLIPFIKLSTVSVMQELNDFDLPSKILDGHIVENKKWKVQLNIKSNIAMNDLSFKAITPFAGHRTLNHVSSSDTLTIPMVLTSKHAQQGQTELKIAFRYSIGTKLIEKILEFVVKLPKPLLQETESSKNFGEMFDL